MALPEEYDRRFIVERQRKLKNHSDELGRMCTLWSGLELDVAHFLIAVSKLEDPATKNVVIGALDFKSKLNALLALSYKRKPSDEWFQDVKDTVNTIDYSLRLERNRMIHDYWFMMPDEGGDEVISRVQLKATVKREPGSGEQSLHLANIKPITHSDISDFCEQIVAANVAVNQLRRAYEHSPFKEKSPLPSVPSK